MGSIAGERAKKKLVLWKKAAVHFLLCFVMGFFTGFAPTGKSSVSSTSDHSASAPFPMEKLHNQSLQTGNINRNRAERSQPMKNNAHGEDSDVNPKRLVIAITPTGNKDQLRGVLLSRLANTLKLVPPPLLWIVVESELEDSGVSKLLRKTGVMYRHLVFKENINDPRVEMELQRNVALNHIEHHRLSGIVHFAGLDDIYDLSFFDEIRAIEVFGAWPLAKLSTRRKKPIIEGPVCHSSQVVGWHLKNPNNQTEEFPIHISGFAFNSSILWDPERWGRLSSSPNTKQNSLKFVKQAAFEDETELKGVPQEDCSRVNIWKLHLSTKTTPIDELPVHLSGGSLR
ncbi:hypothetical protein Nepgr_011933 [Nepenthes gracilis]|uniref:Glycosyltransferases n=1 Tax=Nepenthes gracilis TaxID=150966 RepID=A0AAD3XME5_NEPGR|nr:hypothetical protein Nepgr_011933 [Nepenthes gracilis]